ncbi:hypothetical protein BH20ACT16_BH20ACT16_06930 [soil metagenome]
MLLHQTTVLVTVSLMAVLYIGLWFGLGLTRRLNGKARGS